MKHGMLLMTAAVATMLGSSGVLHAQSAARTVWQCVYTTAQAELGRARYADKCASCHGEALTGHDVAPALTGSVFLDNWSGQTLGDLATRIHDTMPLNDPGSLRNREVTDIVAYILSVNQFPAGGNELPGEPILLRQIALIAEKPPNSRSCPS
jgi:mono/diheme cytochrome c family protein